MKDLELLLPRVLEKVAICPEPTALRHLRDAAVEFCRRTRVWRFEDSFTVDGGGDGEFAVEPDSTVFEVTHARFGDIDLTARTADWLDKNEPGWRTVDPGTPRWLTQVECGSVRINPPPGQTGTLTLELILVPSNDADQLPDVLVDSFGMAIADGALATLLALPAEFGNLQLAAVHADRFTDALGRWSAQIAKGQQRAPRRVKPSPNF